MINFKILQPRYAEWLGFLPEFLSEDDPLPAREQFNLNYAHGGGWMPFEGFKMDPVSHTIYYPGDPSFSPIAQASLRDEEIFVYLYGWVAIVQKDGSFEIARMD